MKKAEEVMELLEAFDLTGSLRAAAELVGCDLAVQADQPTGAFGASFGQDARCCVSTVAARLAATFDRGGGLVLGGEPGFLPGLLALAT